MAQQLAASAPDRRNEMAARSLWSLTRYRPARVVSRVIAPVLVCIGQGDTAASVPLVLCSAGQAPHCEVRLYRGGQFGACTGAGFGQMACDQVEFLQHHLAESSSCL